MRAHKLLYILLYMHDKEARFIQNKHGSVTVHVRLDTQSTAARETTYSARDTVPNTIAICSGHLPHMLLPQKRTAIKSSVKKN